jgi:hypothetical protein
MTLLVTNNVIDDVARGFSPTTAMFLCAAVLLVCSAVGMSSRGIRRIT